jgi:hypothetical protein
VSPVDAATRTVVVAKREPNELVLINADSGAITAPTPLPGSPTTRTGRTVGDIVGHQ